MSLAARLSENPNIVNLLARYGLLETFLVEALKDEKNKNITLSSERQDTLLRDFKHRNGIDNDRKLNEYCKTHLLSKDDLIYFIEKEERSKNYSKKYFFPETQTQSLLKKKTTDLVKYSLLRVSEEGLANELYLQVTEEKANLVELITKYSEGPEKNTNGIIGPLPITKAHPILAEHLLSAKQGQLLKPFQIENWWLIIRIESFVPASLDGTIVENISCDLYQNWLLSEAAKIRSSLKNVADNEITIL